MTPQPHKVILAVAVLRTDPPESKVVVHGVFLFCDVSVELAGQEMMMVGADIIKQEAGRLGITSGELSVEHVMFREIFTEELARAVPYARSRERGA